MPRRKRPVLGTDYIIDFDGKAEFTRNYLLRRESCCEHNCRYCPFAKPQACEQEPIDLERAKTAQGTW